MRGRRSVRILAAVAVGVVATLSVSQAALAAAPGAVPGKKAAKAHKAAKAKVRDRDGDGDGLTNHQEFVVGTSPLNADSDHDGTADGNEDPDGDGLGNHDEFRLGENPNDGDSDDDGTTDGSERAGTIVYYNDVAHSMYYTRLDGTTDVVMVATLTVMEWGGGGCSGTPTYADLVVGRTAYDIKVDPHLGGPPPIATRLKLSCA